MDLLKRSRGRRRGDYLNSNLFEPNHFAKPRPDRLFYAIHILSTVNVVMGIGVDSNHDQLALTVEPAKPTGIDVQALRRDEILMTSLGIESVHDISDGSS